MAGSRRARLPDRPPAVATVALGRVDAAVVSFGLTIGLKLFDPEAYPPPNADIRNPVLGNRLGELIVDTGLWIPFFVGLLASLFAAALAVILRFRRSAGIERLQMLWLAWSSRSSRSSSGAGSSRAASFCCGAT